MPAVKAANPRQIFAPDQWRALTSVSRWRGLALIAHGWAVVALVAGGTAWLWTADFAWSWPVALAVTPLALALLGGRQLGLAILMHEAAHGLTHPKRKTNNFAGDWLAGAATGADLQSYRAYHLTHHRFTQQPEDPDLPLSAPFPVSPESLRRKIIRDLTGQTFVKQRAAQFGYALKGLKALLKRHRPAPLNAQKRDTSAGTVFNRSERTEAAKGDHASSNGVSAPVTDDSGAIATAKSTGRFLLVQVVLVLLAMLVLGPVTGGIAYGLWLVALATTFPLFLRIRNIAEHACTTTGSADPFSHARTTYAGPLARATVAPYWVNYHAEHHLFMGVPCYRLAEAHQHLLSQGHGAKMTIAPDYRSVLRQVTGGEAAGVVA
ncbi:fatty acid desaturase family protein [Alterisphingorhabdus coralli]|uniref:Fatty acid desaturase family protein n=1 Tax=Alterisphingorhabdus coralli TaxID=3071408 RepID=A0AA97I0Y6_9SPHN|nr:fatty acid desaturase family protein [Parasphingorhabdus sp. SCSIO 66989]WOE74700.1 fatty acid desaturase family protein [Parasphingorhabdus sp. SCSIO 66989]